MKICEKYTKNNEECKKICYTYNNCRTMCFKQDLEVTYEK